MINGTLQHRVVLTILLTFLVFHALALAAGLFSVYPSDPYFIGEAALLLLAGSAVLIVSRGKTVGVYLGFLYASARIGLWRKESPYWTMASIWYPIIEFLFALLLVLLLK